MNAIGVKVRESCTLQLLWLTEEPNQANRETSVPDEHEPSIEPNFSVQVFLVSVLS